jgi:hypothetical protein
MFCESVTFWQGSGFGFGVFQDAFYFLMVHIVSVIKNHKEVTNKTVEIKVFLTFFA